MTELDTVEYKGELVGKVLGCEIRIVTTTDGKKHFESECLSKEARDKLASVFEEEAILRVNPKVVLEETPEIPPTVKPYVAEPEPKAEE